LNGLIKAFK